MGLQHPQRLRRAGRRAIVRGLGAAGCSARCSGRRPGRVGQAPRACPRASPTAPPVIHDLWIGTWIAALRRRRPGLGADLLRRASSSAAAATTRSPCRPATTCRWRSSTRSRPSIMVLVFFYFTVDAQNEVLADAERATRRPHVDGRRPAVVLDVQLRRGRRSRRRRRRLRGRHHRQTSRRCTSRSASRSVPAPLARRHPLVLGAGVHVQAGRRPGRDNTLQPDPDP